MKNNESEIINTIIYKVKSIINNKKDQSISHRWDHIWRVYKRVMKLEKTIDDENIDLESLKISALLHDIDQPYFDKKNHVKKSIEKAKQILSNMDYPKKQTDKILKIIKEHSTEDNIKPSSIEAKILYDADKLDGIGAIGISRVFSYTGQNGIIPSDAIKWYIEKIEKAHDNMQTRMGRKEAEDRIKYVKSFIQKFYEEEKI